MRGRGLHSAPLCDDRDLPIIDARDFSLQLVGSSTQQLNRAIREVAELPFGGILQLPDYEISHTGLDCSGIAVQFNRQVIIQGCGWGTRLNHRGDSTANRQHGIDCSGSNYLVFRDFALINDGIDNGKETGFFLSRINFSVSISSLTSSSTTATAITATPHRFLTGQSVTIAGATPIAYNGTYTVSVVDAVTFTYTFAGGTSPATGTLTAAMLSDSCNRIQMSNVRIDLSFVKAAVALLNAEEAVVDRCWIQSYAQSAWTSGKAAIGIYAGTKNGANNLAFSIPKGDLTSTAESCLGNVVTNTTVYSRDNGSCVYLDESVGMTIAGNTLNRTSGGTDVKAGVLLTSPTLLAFTNQVRITNNLFEAGSGVGVLYLGDVASDTEFVGHTITGNEFTQALAPLSTQGKAYIKGLAYRNRHLNATPSISIAYKVDDSEIAANDTTTNINLAAAAAIDAKTRLRANSVTVAGGATWSGVDMRVAPPAATGSNGILGQWAYDTGFFYICTATNTWKRVAIAAW